MCGIAAIISLSNQPIQDAKSRIGRMTEALVHRGPDRQGTYVSPDRLVALGNTRLAIVDANNDFPVPFCSRFSGEVITYNGEIFDHHAQRERLKGTGSQFSTNSDTEVMLEGLSRHTLGFLDRLDGFWSFAHYCPEKRTITAARDLLGEKHLFYRIEDDILTMASEIGPLIADAISAVEFDMEAIASSFQYRAAPPGRTLIKGVQRLFAGQSLKLQAGTRNLEFSRSQILDPSKHFEFFAKDPSEIEVMEKFEASIKQACHLRVPQEVDFKTTLSGGIDSTLVNVFSNRRRSGPTQSIFGQSSQSPARKDDDLDEWQASQLTAQKLGNDHHKINLIDDDCIGFYQHQARNSFDGLFCEGAAAYQQLAHYARKSNGRVLIMSDGPDELLGGYDVDIAVINRDSDTESDLASQQSLRELCKTAHGRATLADSQVNEIVNWAHLNKAPFKFRPAHGGTTPDVMETLFSPNHSKAAIDSFGQLPDEYSDLAKSLDISQKMALSYATSSMPDYYNLRSDRASMAESVELRLPFQSRQLVELMIATPAKWRFKGGRWTKYVLREIVNKHIGPEVAYRNKYGFAYPAWQIPALETKLDMRSVIGDSDIFSTLPFEKGARDFLVRKDEKRHQWMAYSLAQVKSQIQTLKDQATKQMKVLQ